MSTMQATITLPPTLVGTADTARLIREVESLEATITAQEVRHLQVDASRVTQTMADVAAANSLDLAQREHRATLKQQLKLLKSKAPIVHVVFAEQPDPAFLAKIVDWARRELHPRSLLHTGLQPGIIAGCIVRTPSHIYDFSIGSVLKSKKDILTKLIKARTSQELSAEQQALANTHQALNAVVAAPPEPPQTARPPIPPPAPAPQNTDQNLEARPLTEKKFVNTVVAAPPKHEPGPDSPEAVMAREAKEVT